MSRASSDEEPERKNGMSLNDDPDEADQSENPRRDRAGSRKAELAALWERSSRLPPIDPRTDDEILGYDELGTFDRERP